MTTKINGRTPEKITYNCMMYRLKRPNEWDEHCAGSLTLKGRVETAKWAYNYIQQLERERDAAVEAQPKWISVKDELPKKWRENDAYQTLVNYQIYSPRYGVDVGNYVKPAGRWVIMGLPVDDVTHWMPLPESPKEE